MQMLLMRLFYIRFDTDNRLKFYISPLIVFFGTATFEDWSLRKSTNNTAVCYGVYTLSNVTFIPILTTVPLVSDNKITWASRSGQLSFEIVHSEQMKHHNLI